VIYWVSINKLVDTTYAMTPSRSGPISSGLPQLPPPPDPTVIAKSQTDRQGTQ
jgi:hypothetical protein